MSLREAKKAQTRDRIAIAAVEKFMELGAEGATIAVISEAANVSPRTFHNYFTHREDAFLHFCSQYVSESAEFLAELPEQVGAVDALEQLIKVTFSRPVHDVYSWSVLARIATHLKIHLNASDTPCTADTDSLAALSPVLEELIRRSGDDLSPFEALLLLSFSFSLADSVHGITATPELTAGASEYELLKRGFRRIRSGFAV